MLITKYNGTKEEFDSTKLIRSMKLAGASPDVAQKILVQIENELTDGMTTSQIYRRARELLSKHGERPIAARYSLRRAIFELGPSGFPFEQLLGEVLKHRGYEVEVGRTLNGKCVDHEIDVVARSKSELILGEAKFHNSQSVRTDTKVTLYIYARYLDLQANDFDGMCPTEATCTSYLITNTKFTNTAIRYGECVGLKLIGWGYPKEGNVQDIIEESGFHPLSCLTTLSRKEKSVLYKQGFVLCRAVTENPDILKQTGISDAKIKEVLEEVGRLCKATKKPHKH